MKDALRLIEAGRLEEAGLRLDRLVARHPADSGARRLLARLVLQQGRAGDALSHLLAVAKRAPGLPDLNYELGVVYLALDQLPAAVAAFRQELAARPGHLDARFNLAWALRRSGEPAEALLLLRAIVGDQPAHGPAWFNLGNLLLEAGDADGAVAAFTNALSASRDPAGVLVNLGHAHRIAGRLEEACAAFRRALAHDPGHANAAGGLGNALTALGRAGEAVPVYERVLARQPGDVTVLLNLALALKSLDRLDEALAWLHRGVRLAPGNGDLWNGLGVTAMAANLLPEAERAFACAVALRPGFAEAHSNLGITLGRLGRNDEALAAFRRAHAIDPDDPAIHSNLLFQLLHMPAISRQAVFEEHRRYGERQEALAGPPPPLPRRRPDEAERRLRIGYVSPDFCEHAVMLYVEPILERHNKSEVEVFGYHTGSRHDEVTARLRLLCDHWRSLAHLPAGAAADLIRSDGIDILVDLAGHTARNGLPIFARKPAPLQVTWLGYPGTTGLSRIDYRFTNPSTDPPGQNDEFYTERLLRLDGSASLRPPRNSPAVTPPPLLASGRCRFGAFNKPQKINARVIAVWIRILHAVPDSSLLMVVPGGSQAEVRAGVRAPFLAEGIEAGRIEVVEQAPVMEFLRLVASTDIALDPFPYSGGSTTTLTLWMGVPVVCLTGAGASSSTSAGIVGCTPFAELIAADEDAYVAAACRLAGDPGHLAAIRAVLRDRLAESAVMDDSWMVGVLEAAYRELWRDHVRGCPAAGDVR